MKVYTCIKSKSRNVNVRDIVQVGIVLQDSGKMDHHSLTGVVANINIHYEVCQVAVAGGVLRPWYVYHKL